MASSSPAPRVSRYPRASTTFSSPPSSSLVDWISPDRNSEKSHKEALALADAEHRRIRERAEHVLWMHEKEEEADVLAEKTRRENEKLEITEKMKRLMEDSMLTERKRIQAEQQAKERERQLRELKATKVAPLSPVQPQPAQPPVAAQTAAVAPSSASASTTQPIPAQKPAPATTDGTSTTKAAASSLFSPPKATAPAVPSTPTPAAPVATTTAPATQPVKTDPKKQRALLIHKNLKDLRKSINDVQAKQNPALKSKAGDLRRELRKCVGQLSFDKKGNAAVITKVSNVLQQGLLNEVNSQLVDPSHFVFDERQPVNGAAHNDQLPSLFLFLVNHLGKCVINQFIDESSANTKTADPIGILVAATFADPAFHWRGKPLIDILIAKFYVVCPVLFGARGLEKTEQGRERVGWKRRGNGWIPETEHYNRQTGLGAGYAAISLRDFSRSKKANPYPMSHYWSAMAQIVNTPPAEMSTTSCTVLKAMIDHYEHRFLLFYGTAAIAALRLALVDFPTNAKSAGRGDVAVESLIVHGKSLKAKYGLALA